jgi:transketolase
MSYESSVQAKAIELAKLAVEMTTAAGSGHPTTAASLAHLVTVLMYDQMRWDPADPKLAGCDRLVLSEGHAVPIVYAAAADLGVRIGREPGQLRPMTREDAMQLRAIGSEIDGHPNPLEGFPFFDAATGSLGQGLSIAAGLGCAARLDGSPRRVFCIIGDGESREGQIAEALDFIVDHKLTMVLPIFNCNVYAQSDAVSHQQSAEVLARKLEAYGFAVRVIDGHDPAAIRASVSATGELTAIVAKTVKGWGAPTIQGPGHHGTPVKPAELAKVLGEFDETARRVGAAWTEGELTIKRPEWSPPMHPGKSTPITLTEALIRAGKADALKKGLATRRAYGLALQALGHANASVVALDGDVKNSTFAEDFAKDERLKERYFEARIAEQNMFSVAAGLSAGGKIPFASTFAKFVTRGYDQIEMAINSGANLKIVGSHAGVSLAADGPSQMSLPDIAWFRAFTGVKLADGRPAMYLLQPSDPFAAYQLTLAMADHDGPCYMRTLRPELPALYDDHTPFTLGGHEVVEEGSDLLIIASGYMVHEAASAMETLSEQGIEATLVDLYSIPFDAEAILDLAAENSGRVLTVEDNYGTGIGSAVADVIAGDDRGITLRQMTVKRVPKSGRSPDDVLKFLGLAAEDIVREAHGLVEVAAG